MPGFITNKALITETNKTDDLLDFSHEIDNLEKIIEEISTPSIIGLVGRFGSGKSTMLYQLRKKSKGFWLEFDAWKYPERKNLWEGFVLDFAETLGEKENTRKKIDAESKKSGKELITTASKGIYFVPGLNLVAPIIEKTIGDATKYFLSESPITRVYQLQDLLESLFKQVKSDIYIVVEDIDRSQDAGVFFLETLKQFIQNLKIEKKVVVLVPIGSKNFVNYRDEYSKCIDYFEDFYPNNGLKHFVEIVIKDMQLDTPHNMAVTQTASFLEQFTRENSEQITMREIKRILRQANEHYIAMEKRSQEPDWRVTIAVESMRLIYNGEGVPYFRYFRDRGRVDKGSWERFFHLILLNNSDWNFSMLNQRVSWEIRDHMVDALEKFGGNLYEQKTTYHISSKYFV